MRNRTKITNYLEDSKKYFLFSYKFGTIFTEEEIKQAISKVYDIRKNLGFTSEYIDKLFKEGKELVYMIEYKQADNIKVLSTRNSINSLVETKSFGSEFRMTIETILRKSNMIMEQFKEKKINYPDVTFAIYIYEKDL